MSYDENRSFSDMDKVERRTFVREFNAGGYTWISYAIRGATPEDRKWIGTYHNAGCLTLRIHAGKLYARKNYDRKDTVERLLHAKTQCCISIL